MRLSLKQKSALFVAVSTFVLLCAYAFISVQFIQQKTDNIIQSRKSETEAVAATINPFLKNAGEKIQSVSELRGLVPALDELAKQQNDQRDLASTLHYIFLNSNIFTGGVFLVNPKGRILWDEPSDQIPAGSSFPSFSLVQKDIEANQSSPANQNGQDPGYVFSIAMDSNGKGQILVSSPLVDRRDDSVVGTLIGAIPVDHDTIAVAMAEHTSNGQMIQIIDSAGTVVVGADDFRMGVPLPQPASGVVDSKAGDLGNLLVAFAKMPASHWIITIEQDRKTALAEANALLVVLSGFGIGFIALAMAILFFVIRSFTEPIERLTADARRIAGGDLNVQFDSGRTDEIGILAAALDEMKSKLKTSYDRLLISEKMSLMGQIVAGIAHELNNPLTIVIGHAELMMQDDHPPNVKGPLSKIRDGAERAAKIVRNLLTFARQQKPSRKATDVNSVILKTVELRAYELKVSNIQLVTDLAPVPHTMSDEHQLQQVFLNLIVNAEQAMLEAHARGRLAIHSCVKDDHIEITFEDDGPGIKEENLRRVFDPFFTTKEVGKGTGLGLSICQAIIAEHGGRLTVSSTVGTGTRFLVELPIVLSTTNMVQPVAAPAVVMIRKNVLVIDDEGHLRELFRELLTRDGHRIETATNGREALEMIHRQSFDLVVTDIKMPETDGVDFYRQLKSEHSALADRLLFVTGDLMNPDTVRFLESTGNPWIAKPFELSAVRAAVNKALSPRVA